MIEVIALFVVVCVLVGVGEFAYRVWRLSLARMYLAGYALGSTHAKEGFPVAPVHEGEQVPDSFARGMRS